MKIDTVLSTRTWLNRMLRCKVFFRSFTTILLYSTVKTNSSQVPCCRFQRGATCQEALPPKTSSPTSHKNGTEHFYFLLWCVCSQSNGIPFILSPLNRTFSYTFITCSRCWALFHPALITCYDTLHTPLWSFKSQKANNYNSNQLVQVCCT